MRLLPPHLVLLFLVIMVALRMVVPGPEMLPHPWNWLGLLPAVAGFGLAVAGARRFARLHTNIKTFDEPTILVADGLFKWSRNPMYLGFGIFLSGAGLLLETLLPLLIAPLFIVITDRWYIAFEERMMLRKFGAAYDDYRKTTRRWI